jgi:hypothetical protein
MLLRPVRSKPRLALILVSISCLASCGGSDAPTRPTAGATPAPTPTPTPVPTPDPTPTPPIGISCADIPDGNGSGRDCSKRSEARFLRMLEDAVDIARSSGYQDPDSGQSVRMVAQDGQIIAARAYVARIIEELDAQGLCSVFDGEEIQIRDSGVDNENFDVITSSGFSWANYVVTCAPALPMPTPPPVPTERRDPTCPLPPSAPYLCVRQTAQLDGPVYAAQDALIELDRSRDVPRVFDFGDRIGGTTYGYRIIDDDAYVDGMLEQLRERGLCASFDGEEFNVKRDTNIFSENYDMTKQDGFAIRIYNATCRDASF